MGVAVIVTCVAPRMVVINTRRDMCELVVVSVRCPGKFRRKPADRDHDQQETSDTRDERRGHAAEGSSLPGKVNGELHARRLALTMQWPGHSIFAGTLLRIGCLGAGEQAELRDDFDSARFDAKTMNRLAPGITSAILAALLFGASTPIAKRLLGEMPPQMLAGLLYLGSGVGLALVLAVRVLRAPRAGLALTVPEGREWAWLAGATFFGGIIGPLLLLIGLRVTTASSASLLLNLESVFTALLAWFAFRENFDRRIALGMALIVAGGLVLAWQPDGARATGWGALAVAAACLCWGLDNNLTRKVSAGDAVLIACIKGLAAGTVNVSIAALTGQSWPALNVGLLAGLLGFASYGVSLTLFVIALRHLGSARTGAYFSVAPFFGTVLAVATWNEPLSAAVAAGGVLMALGVWLHVTERHEHAHTHDALEHEHAHTHEEHHRHDHAFAWDGAEPHTHRHAHAPLRHKHPHYPDIHHRHTH